MNDQLDLDVASICNRLREGEHVDLDQEIASLQSRFADADEIEDAIRVVQDVASEYA
jgi:hypothetical protein